MEHRISAGALVIHNNHHLLARHYKSGIYDYWAPPGGGVEDNEQLSAAAERETFEETRIKVLAERIAYIDELIDAHGRMIKFWFLCKYVSGSLNHEQNPCENESIVQCGWFSRNCFPSGHVFPEVVRNDFWQDIHIGSNFPIKLPLKFSIF